MLNIKKSMSVVEKNIPFGYVEVHYPAREEWNEGQFRAFVEEKICELKKKYAEYDRKAVFGENPYYRFFKKFKKTYPVMLQFESLAFKGRPFPDFNPVTDVAFLLEVTTFVLSGTHDIDQLQGGIELYLATEKEDFEGMREMLHTYPGDCCARDDRGIIFSEIAGTDNRTCAKPDSRNVFYPIFGTPDLPKDIIEGAMETLVEYIKVLAPAAEIEKHII